MSTDNTFPDHQLPLAIVFGDGVALHCVKEDGHIKVKLTLEYLIPILISYAMNLLFLRRYKQSWPSG